MVLWCVFYALYVMYVFWGIMITFFGISNSSNILENDLQPTTMSKRSKTWKQNALSPPPNQQYHGTETLEGELFARGKIVIPHESQWISCCMFPVISNTSLGRSRSLPALGMGSGTASRWVFICFSCDFNVLFFMVGEPRFKVVFPPISAVECGFDVEFWKSCGLAFVFALKLC